MPGVSSPTRGAAKPSLASGGAAFRKGKRGPVGKVCRNAEIVQLVKDGAALADVASAFDVCRARVWQIVQRAAANEVNALREMRLRHKLDARADRYLPLYEAGLTLREVGARFGVTGAAVCYAINAHPDYRPRRASFPHSQSNFEVPGWVDPEHRDRYLRIAAGNGEEVAASCIRRLKRLEAAPC